MAAGPFAVGLDPGNLGFEQGDPLGQLVLRIAVKAFTGQEAGGIAGQTGPVIIVHRLDRFTLRALAVNRTKG